MLDLRKSSRVSGQRDAPLGIGVGTTENLDASSTLDAQAAVFHRQRTHCKTPQQDSGTMKLKPATCDQSQALVDVESLGES